MEAKGQGERLIEVLALRTLALQGQGKTKQALGDLERALARGAPDGYLRTVVDEGPVMYTLLEQLYQGYRTGTRVRCDPIPLAYLRRILIASQPPRARLEDRQRLNERLPEGEQLSERERDILGLLVAGHLNYDRLV